MTLCTRVCGRSNLRVLLYILATLLGAWCWELYITGDDEGAEDVLNPLQYVDDGIHSIVGGDLPVLQNQVMHNGDGEKLSRSFRLWAHKRCKPDKNHLCAVSPEGLSTVGLVHYTFNSSRTQRKGEALQSLLACRCLSSACNYSIAAVPVVIQSNGNSKRRSCLYMRLKKGKRSVLRCLAPLLNVTKRPRSPNIDKELPILALRDAWDFAINHSLSSWKAHGVRDVSLRMSEEEFRSFPSENIRAINVTVKPECSDVDDINPSDIELVADQSSLSSPEKDPCSERMKFAMEGAAWKGGEHDRTNIGENDADYPEQQPEVLSDIELAFVAAATVIGLATAAKLLYSKSQRDQTGAESVCVLFMALFVYLLEALLLYTSYAVAYKSFTWRGAFSNVDAALAAHRNSTNARFNATDSVFVLVVSSGSTMYQNPKHTEMAVLMAIASFVFLVTVVSYAKHEWKNWMQLFAGFRGHLPLCTGRVRNDQINDNGQNATYTKSTRLHALLLRLLVSKNEAQNLRNVNQGVD